MRYTAILFVTCVAFATTGCQDLPPQPGYVTLGYNSETFVAPSSTATGRTARLASHYRERPYFVEFRARYALSYGHTYVVFGRMNSAGRAVNPEVAGLHPKSTSPVPYVLGHFVPVPAETGWSDGDLEEQYRAASWRVMLTKPEYDDAVAKIRKLQARAGLWQASVYNCNAFTGDIARAMGFKVPSRYLRPQQFITQLREMNTGSRTVAQATSARQE